MSVGDVLKWILLVVVALLLWSWLKSGAHLNVGPGESNQYPIGQPGGFAGGTVLLGGGKNGGLTWGLNFPWSERVSAGSGSVWG